MPRLSLEIVVVVIILLIVALVVMGIFTGGIQNFTNIFNAQSDEQIKRSLCQTACANYCFTHPPTGGATPSADIAWGGNGVPLPAYKGQPVTDCSSLYGGNCKC